jgi:raffinose/stachyose/melibiose transport system substrate-binding protein
MKRHFVFALLALVLLALVAMPAAAQTKLTVWGRDVLDDDPAHVYVANLIKDFQAKNPGITLEYVPLGDPGLADKTKIAMAAGTGLPDIFQTWGGNTMGGYADAGRLLDLTADLKNVPGSAAAASAMTWKGKLYGVAPFFAICGLFVNEGIFKANNLTVPTTIADLEKVADALVKKGIQPFSAGGKDKWPILHAYMYLVDRIGGIGTFNDAAARKARFDGPVFVQAAQMYQSWFKKGYFGSAPLGEDYSAAQQLMYTGKAAMQITGSWMCGNYSSSEYTNQTIGFYAIPALTGGKGPVTDVMGMTDIGWAATSAAASKKAAVVTFMKYAMSSDAGSKEPGRVAAMPGVKAPSKLTQMASDVFNKAKNVQFWWDQNLDPAVTTPCNETIQTFFIPGTDVKASLTKFEDLVSKSAMGPVK